MTAREAALLQTFPKTWQFCGPFDDRFKQIGNAVPPLAAAAFANVIAAGVDFEGGSEDEVGVREITDEPVGKSFSVLIPGIRRRAHS
jgi:DNA (cytosine-5)-methyltransferase 1